MLMVVSLGQSGLLMGKHISLFDTNQS